MTYRRGFSRRVAWPILKYVLLILISLWTLLPFFWMFSASLMTTKEIIQTPPPLWPAVPQWQNYANVAEVVNIGHAYLNSIVVAVAVVVGLLFTSSLTGFAFAKYNFPFKNVLFAVILATMMIPFFVILIPVFWIVKQFGWINNYAGLIFPSIVSAYGIFLMRQFISGIPDELLDAARIDGASEFRIYWQIVIPLTGPALATLGVFNLVAVWNAFLWPLLVVQDSSLYTVPLALNSLRTYGAEERVLNLRMAGTVLSVIPTVLVFAWLQRFFARGHRPHGPEGLTEAEHGAWLRPPCPPSAVRIGGGRRCGFHTRTLVSCRRSHGRSEVRAPDGSLRNLGEAVGRPQELWGNESSSPSIGGQGGRAGGSDPLASELCVPRGNCTPFWE